jgi:DNA-binding MarR family transcriptional regulator
MTLEQRDVAESTGYWYDAGAVERGIAVLNALRAYRTAEQAMRKRTRDSMGMGDTDLAALRLLLAAERTGTSVSPGDLAKRLGITGASVSVMLDRLEKSGHVERRADPNDGRRVVVVATISSDSEVRETLGGMHVAMMDVAQSLDPDEAEAVERFLRRMTAAVSELHPH